MQKFRENILGFSKASNTILFILPAVLLLAWSISTSAKKTTIENSTNYAVFNISNNTPNIPTPNILLTSSAPVQLYVSADKNNLPILSPQNALLYVSQREMSAIDKNAVSGLNAPITLSFNSPINPTTFNEHNVKVFHIMNQDDGHENKPLVFTDISSSFTYEMNPAGITSDPNIPILANSIGSVYPKFPLDTVTKYIYVVTNRVLDAATNLPVISSDDFKKLKSITPLLTEQLFETIRADTQNIPNISLRGYYSVMNDLIDAHSVTTIKSRDNIVLMGRFITTGAGSILRNINDKSSATPVECLLREWATNSFSNIVNNINVSANVTAYINVVKSINAPYTDDGKIPIPYNNIKRVVTGTFNSALLNMDIGTMDALKQEQNFNPTNGTISPYNYVLNYFSGVRQVQRDDGGNFKAFYNVAKDIPFVYMEPDYTKLQIPKPESWPLAIFVHGAGGQKENVALIANAIASTGRAILAFDQPLHGELETSGHIIPIPGLSQEAYWATDYLAIGAPLASRTNVEQASLNFYRCIACLTNINVKIGNERYDAPISLTDVGYIGISLGAITGVYTMAGMQVDGLPLSNMPAVFSAPGARTVYALRDTKSPSLSFINDNIINNILNKYSLPWYQFISGTQTIRDTVDPASVTSPLKPGEPSRLSGRCLIQEIINDVTVPNSATDYLVNALAGRSALVKHPSYELNAIAPNFYQLSYSDGRIVNPVINILNNWRHIVPKTARATSKKEQNNNKNIHNEGFFQIDTPNSGHTAIIDLNDPAYEYTINQAGWFLGHHFENKPRTVTDPTTFQ